VNCRNDVTTFNPDTTGMALTLKGEEAEEAIGVSVVNHRRSYHSGVFVCCCFTLKAACMDLPHKTRLRLS
jgi:hypothetical protein